VAGVGGTSGFIGTTTGTGTAGFAGSVNPAVGIFGGGGSTVLSTL
jgi:hypothetical protein